jgi:hypothetical protein
LSGKEYGLGEYVVVFSISVENVSSFGFSVTIVSHIEDCDLSDLALTTVISGLYLLPACLIKCSRDTFTIFSKLIDLPLNPVIIRISNFLKSNNSLTNISIVQDISSIWMKNHFFFALWMFLMYHTIIRLPKPSFSLNCEMKLYLFIYVYNQSNGLPETNTLNTSYSSISLSIIVVDGHGLNVILVLISIIPNNHPTVSFDFFAHSKIVSLFANKTPRSPKLSSAHAFINHSMDFLFTIEAHLLMKSSMFGYMPFTSLSF